MTACVGGTCEAFFYEYTTAWQVPSRVSWLDWAREALTATLAAQILALPLILCQIGNLAIVAPLANVALLPMVPSAMLFGALALAGGMLWLPLGQWLALPAYLFLAWLMEGARLFARLPYAAVQLPSGCCWRTTRSWWAAGCRRCELAGLWGNQHDHEGTRRYTTCCAAFVFPVDSRPAG
jgi:hypothetical protein